MSRSKRRVRKNKRKRFLVNLSSFIFSLFILICIFSFFNTNKFQNNTTDILKDSKSDQATSYANKEPSTLTLSAAGDVMAHKPQLQAQYNPTSNTYNFDNNFKYVKPILEKSDLSIANLETTLAGTSTPYTSYPTFNSPDELIDGLKYAGVDLLSTINNHSFDKGDLGVNKTLQTSKSKGFDTVGTSLNPNDKRYVIKNINDISLGVCAFSYGEIVGDNKFLNGIKISEKSKNSMNIFDMTNVDKAFNVIKNELENIKNTDMQVLILHWGNEYQRVPSEFQIELAKKLSDIGVDIIIGSHPHVVQPVEMIQSSDKKNNTLVIYSLGNFISNQRQELMSSAYTEDGLIANIKITKDYSKNKTYISSVECIPTWVNKYKIPGNYVYEIIPIYSKNQISEIDNIPLEKLKLSFDNTISQIKTSDIIKVPQNPFK